MVPEVVNSSTMALKQAAHQQMLSRRTAGKTRHDSVFSLHPDLVCEVNMIKVLCVKKKTK